MSAAHLNPVPRSLAEIIEDQDAGAVALIDGATTVTYGELRDRVSRLRSGLSAAGVGPTDRVMLIGENEADFVVAAFAILGLGAIVSPIRSRNPMPEVERKMTSVRPSVTVLCETADWLLPHAEALPCDQFVSVSQLDAAPAENDVPIAQVDGDDLAFLLLTSGVASESKVAMLSHSNLLWVQSAIIDGPKVGLGSDDIALCILPLTHIFGLNVVLLSTLRAGGTVVLQRRFDVDESLNLIGRHKVTTLSGAPPMWQQWAQADAVNADTFATVRYAASGAAALSAETFDLVKERFGVELSEGYGLTETSPVVTSSRGVPSKPGSVGVPLDGVEVVLVEEDGTPVEPGDAGEVVVRGPGIFKGYLDAPELTEQVLTDDGWFWTGDIGVFDADGYLYLVDRIKDIIIVSGFNVYPSEVEAILMEHPNVRGAIVVGVADGLTGEAVEAHVSGQVDVDELDQFCRDRLSRYKCPARYHLVEELPVTAHGKVVRRELRQ